MVKSSNDFVLPHKKISNWDGICLNNPKIKKYYHLNNAKIF